MPEPETAPPPLLRILIWEDYVALIRGESYSISFVGKGEWIFIATYTLESSFSLRGLFLDDLPRGVADMMFVSDQNVRTVFKAEPSEKTETFVGVDFEALPLQGVLTPWAIEYDGMDDMIYWSDQGSAEIARSRLDGSNRTTIVIQPVVVCKIDHYYIIVCYASEAHFSPKKFRPKCVVV